MRFVPEKRDSVVLLICGFFFYRNKQKTCCYVRDKYFNLEKKLVCKGTKYIMKKERSRIMDDRLLYRTVYFDNKMAKIFQN